MDSKRRRFAIARPRVKTYYERWIDKEAVPIVEGFGVSDVRNLKLGKWQRLGCEGAYLQLRGIDRKTPETRPAPGGSGRGRARRSWKPIARQVVTDRAEWAATATLIRARRARHVTVVREVG